MPPVASQHDAPRRPHRIVWYLAAGWVLVTGASLAWHLAGEKEKVFELSRMEARASYDKDLLYRRWATQHGGVYVPPTAETPPNPFLKDIPDRDVVTTGGKALTLINPAYMTRQVFELGQRSNGRRSHLTSLKPMRPDNAPDAWEREALEAFERGTEEVSSVATIEGAEFIRLMRPMITESGCLKCHAGQGYRVGEIRGGISVSVPLAPYWQEMRRHLAAAVGIHVLFGTLGVAGLMVGARRLDRSWTERLAAEAALRAVEERWQVAVEFAGDGLWEWSVDQNTAFYSPRWKAMLGYADDELANEPGTWRNLLHPDDRARVEAALHAPADRATPFFESEHRLRCKDGSYRWMLVRGRVTARAANGRALRALGTSQDITAHRTLEAQLKKNHDMLAKLAAQVPGVICQYRLWPDGRSAFPFASPGMNDIYEVTPEQVREDATPVFGRLHPDDHDRVAADIMESARTLRLFQCEFRVVLPRQGLRWRWSQAMPERTEDGGTLWHGIISDITERKHAEEALRHSERQLALALELARAGSWEFDAATGTLTFNDGFYSLYGTSAGREGGYQMPAETYAREFLLPEERSLVAAEMNKIRTATESKGQWTIEHRIRRRDGAIRHFSVAISIVSDETGRITGYRGVNTDITERVQAEAALRKLSRAVEQSPVTVVITDTTGAIEYANPQFTKVTGYTLAEVLGQNPRVLKSGAQPADIYREMWSTISAGREWRGELCNRRKDGTLYWEDASISPVCDESGRITHYLAVKEDITARRETLAALQQSEQRFRSLVESLPNIAVQGYDRDRRVVFWNPASTALYGYTREEAMGRQLEDLIIPPAMRAAVVTAVDRWITHGEVIPAGELELRRKDGSAVSVFSSHVMLRQLSGEPEMHCIDIDLTARKTAEARIREQAALLDVVRDAIIVVDLGGVIRFWNRGAVVIYGWSAAEAVGRDIFTLVYDDAHPAPKEARRTILEKGEWAGELSQRASGGATVLVRARGFLLRDPAGAPYAMLLTATDITEARRFETQFLRAQRLESVGALASGVAHDLNNVLSPIMMSVELLRPLAVTPEDREILRLMSDSARRGADVVRQLLLFGRGSDAPSDTMDVALVVKEIVRMMRETFPRNLTIGGQVPRDLWPIRGHTTQIYQILLNLCVNARDAMPAGGQLNVDARNLHLDDIAAKLSPGAKPGRYVELTVTDTGAGIPPAIIDRIFDPFFTTKETGKGTGLGLSTVVGITKSHGGFVTVSSSEGQGSEFRVYLPAVNHEGNRPAPGTADVRPRGRGETVLLVDDEVSIRQIVGRALRTGGCTVLMASNGDAALEIARAHQADLRAVVLDMMMPGLDGPSVVLALRALLPDLPIVACSGLDRYRDELAALGLPRVRFLRKPFNADQLWAELRAELDGPPPGMNPDLQRDS